MDEVDKIIIMSLKEIGCKIEDDVVSLKNFTTEMVIEAAAKCIEVIQPGSDIPSVLPASMAVRFQVGATIAQTCTELGYLGEVGYQTFLYSNEADLRKVLMFLIERLPKESEKIGQEPSDRASRLRADISATITKQLTTPWVPSFCKENGIRWHEDGSFTVEGGAGNIRFDSSPIQLGSSSKESTTPPQAWRDYCVRHLPFVPDQVAEVNHLFPSLILLNSRGILAASQLQSKNDSVQEILADLISEDAERCLIAEQTSDKKISSRFALSEKLLFSPEKSPEKRRPAVIEPSKENTDTVEERQKQQEAAALQEVEKLKETNERMKENIEQLQMEIKTLSAKLPKVSQEKSAAERVLKDAEKQELVTRAVADLLPDAEGNIAKLQSKVEELAQKLLNLAEQWESRRAPLLQEYREARKLHSSKASESARQAESLRITREKSAELLEELRTKEELHSQLQAEYARISKDISRSAYTRRIMEIIGNINKQKDGINKVLNDTRQLHREINSLSGRLDRSFAVADELIFRDAKRDDVSRRAYKLLATLHSECAELVKMVEETGTCLRESRDLEDQIETESAKKVSANLERISADLRQMKQETAALTAQLKNKS